MIESPISADQLSKKILEFGNTSSNEEELKIKIEHELRTILKNFGLPWGRYEKEE